MTIIYIILAFVGGATVSAIVVQIVQKARAKSIIDAAQIEAETLKKSKLLEVKEKYIQLKAEYEKQMTARNAKIQSIEAKIKQKELFYRE